MKKKLLGERYEFGEVIGEGGEGEVYRGYDLRLGIDVALKKVSGETALGSKLNSNCISFDHPSFPRVTDLICEEGCQYIVMDYLEGPNGAEFVQNFGVLKGEALLEIAIKICNAMKYLHKNKKVFHTDLKPENIIFCRNGEVKFIDVGGLDFEGVEKTERKIGTPGFVAPELCNFGEITVRSEVFAFGATLYFLATGRVPKIEKLISPSLQNKHIDCVVEEVIYKCLKLIPRERYRDFDEIISLLCESKNSEKFGQVLSLNFVNNADLAFEYARLMSEKLNFKVLCCITREVFLAIDDERIDFDTQNEVAFVSAIEAMFEGECTDITAFSALLDGKSGVHVVVIPEGEELKKLGIEYIREKSKEFDTLIFISLMDLSLFADINVYSLSGNSFEEAAIHHHLNELKIESENFRFIKIDGILNLEIAKQLGGVRFDEKVANRNKPGGHSRNAEASSLRKRKMGGS